MAEKKDESTVFVGSKPVMNYVLAVVTQFNNDNEEISIKARGRTISKAVDVAEIVSNRFMKTTKTSRINIGTEKIQGDSGEINVSTIEIVMSNQETGSTGKSATGGSAKK